MRTKTTDRYRLVCRGWRAWLRTVTCGLALVVGIVLAAASSVSAQATITDRSLKLSNSVPATTSDYEVSFEAAASATLGSIKIEFCSNTALFELACVPPSGFDASAAVLSAQSGDVGFSIDPASTANVIILTRTASAGAGAPSSYTFSAIENATGAGSQYARYSTYPTTDASGPIQDRGSVAYALNPPFGLSTEVPPNIEFCLAQTIASNNCSSLAGSYVSLGDFSTNAARTGRMQMAVSTNAANGYAIYVNGNSLASGTNVLPGLNTPTLSLPGTSQFGINLRANSNPQSGEDPVGPGSGMPYGDYNIPDRFVFRSGDVVATKNNVEDYRKYTVTYLVNISSQQPVGVYAGTYTYVAIGNF